MELTFFINDKPEVYKIQTLNLYFSITINLESTNQEFTQADIS